MSVRRVAVFSVHTSPLAQPGAGDGGGMNVYVREYERIETRTRRPRERRVESGRRFR